jgi:hypothetical protein
MVTVSGLMLGGFFSLRFLIFVFFPAGLFAGGTFDGGEFDGGPNFC